MEWLPTVCLLMICKGFRGISLQPGVVATWEFHQNSEFSTFREIYRKPLHIISEPTVVSHMTPIAVGEVAS